MDTTRSGLVAASAAINATGKNATPRLIPLDRKPPAPGANLLSMDIVPTRDLGDICAFGCCLFQYPKLLIIRPVPATFDASQNFNPTHSSSLMTSLMKELVT
nr:hypothetical protein [Rhizobium binae]